MAVAARREGDRDPPSRAFRLLSRDMDVGQTPENRRTNMRQGHLFHSGLPEIASSLRLTQTMHTGNLLVSAFGAGLIWWIATGRRNIG